MLCCAMLVAYNAWWLFFFHHRKISRSYFIKSGNVSNFTRKIFVAIDNKKKIWFRWMSELENFCFAGARISFEIQMTITFLRCSFRPMFLLQILIITQLYTLFFFTYKHCSRLFLGYFFYLTLPACRENRKIPSMEAPTFIIWNLYNL